MKTLLEKSLQHTNCFKDNYLIDLMSKIYFAGSIRGGRDDVELYLQLIKHLQKYGEVLTEHVGDKKLAIIGEDGLSDERIHDRDMAWLRDSRSIVAEVTTASLGVGYELGRVAERNLWVPEQDKKRILCLYRPQVDRRLSAMIAGSKGMTNKEYKSLEEAKSTIDAFFTRLQ